MQTKLGNTLLIANPSAQNGNGAAAARYAGDELRKVIPASDFTLVMTEDAFHARKLAKDSQTFDTVLALGGDGLFHEVVNGLMSVSQQDRPVFGILPVGTGNDFARTLSMDFTIEKAIQQILNAHDKDFDLGLCNDEYFVETMSFGLDAAIALDTVERRKRTGKTGTRLFLESGMDILFHHMKPYDYRAIFDGLREEAGKMFLFAVQIGVTYGGGFAISPDAKTDDGLFDICIAHPPLNIAKAILIFLLAKNAHHTRFKQLEFKRVKSLTLEFDEEGLPVQIDGEPFSATRFEIECVAHAYKVLVPC